MQVHQLQPPRGSKKRRKIVGRGRGSGHGKTSCRGQKGQNARSGRGILIGLEGGQIPLIRRIPKLGFRSQRPVVYQLVQLKDLTRVKEGAVIDAQFLLAHNLIENPYKPYKILGEGDIKKPFTIQAYSFSKSAEDKIVKAGGKIEVINPQILKEQLTLKKK